MNQRKVLAVMTAITGDRVVVGELEVKHVIEEHFQFVPVDMILELVEKILKDPTEIYEERTAHLYHLFYRLEDGRYLVVVIKKGKTGNYFSSVYPTGKSVRKRHRGLRKVKL